MTRGARAEAAAERKLSATTAGASEPRRLRNASDSCTCCLRALASLLPSFVAGSARPLETRQRRPCKVTRTAISESKRHWLKKPHVLVVDSAGQSLCN